MIVKILYYVVNLSKSEDSLYLKTERGVNVMTQPELILRLVEMLLAERDKNNNSMKVEEKTNKD